ncbi:MAG TPA: NAD(P)H:quinone oxidoreductase [Oceanospirillales bacterium]|nr:NAD(P)H:quinone oxidoreductase [Oceanospirillales bacterium]
MAKLIARGIESQENTNAIIRTVKPIGNEDFDSADPIVSESDLNQCDGLILGSPARFGNMAAPLKLFMDETGLQWFSGTLSNKPAAVFTSSSSLHGGQEATLLTMMLPLLHHGMILVGLPYSEKSLLLTESGGTPYGASHWSGNDSDRKIDKHEKNLCIALGKRVADIAKKQKSL